jgi:hypothetical protein
VSDDDVGLPINVIWPKSRASAMMLLGRCLLQAGAAIIMLGFAARKMDAK